MTGWRRPRPRVSLDNSERAFAVLTTTTIAAFVCPVCRGAVRTRSLARSTCRQCYEWVCHQCAAHGMVHARPNAPAAAAPESCR